MARAGLALLAAAAVGFVLVSGGESADPRTPAALPGLPSPFLGTAVVGNGGMTAAIDAYGNVVDLRVAPAGPALIDNPYDRQLAGSVASDTGIVPRVSIGGGPALPLWLADSVSQRYLPGTNVVRTEARLGAVEVVVTDASRNGELARLVEVRAPRGVAAVPSIGVNLTTGAPCRQRSLEHAAVLVCGQGAVPKQATTILARAIAADRRWIARARALGARAPGWARQLYERSLLVLRALTDRQTGAAAAGARDGWAYVWPRDAGTAALAFAAAGYRAEARRVAGFLLALDLYAAARFHGNGNPALGRAAQGDATGWVTVAAAAAGLTGSKGRAARASVPLRPAPWRDRADYREGDPGSFLANAIASDAALGPFDSGRGLTREAADATSGLDSAAAWAVRPFPQPSLFPAVRETLLRLAAGRTRFGIVPGEDWPGADPWSAPTAWSAWSLAGLGERRAALGLLATLRRAATPAGALPERVDVVSGVPVSTTPLAWSHAFTVLALQELWPTPG